MPFPPSLNCKTDDSVQAISTICFPTKIVFGHLFQINRLNDWRSVFHREDIFPTIHYCQDLCMKNRAWWAQKLSVECLFWPCTLFYPRSCDIYTLWISRAKLGVVVGFIVAMVYNSGNWLFHAIKVAFIISEFLSWLAKQSKVLKKG